ncbi:anti-sigma factor domain-containing protein [Acidimangrovimonas sediminis]|uniref:anti-sigma factor domain-containing protein n=1 Tax=Acidimangrovimonas sediminis TaxID=2056283 RepID=UPI000C80DDEB|nr:anti-sigma factor [Acidimangrovimonas sediminis]
MTDETGPIAGLLTQVAHQDREAFGGLYRAVSARLYGVALRILGNRAEAELTLQDVFTRMWVHPAWFDPDHERGIDFLIGLTRDCAIDRRRARPDRAGPAGPEASFMKHEEEMRVTPCMQKLDGACSAALRSGYLGGLSYAELAAVTGKPEAEMRSFLHGCLSSLKDCVGAAQMHGVVPPDDDGSEDGLFAAEFVLGSLDHDARREAERRLANPAETRFRAHVSTWRARFSPLNASYVAVSAPDLTTQIEAWIFGTPARVQQTNLKRLGMAIAGGVAAVILVAAVTVIAVRDMTPAPRIYAATLDAEGQPLVFAAAWDSSSRKLEVLHTAGAKADPGKAYNLWLLGMDGKASPLLVLREEETVTLVSRIPEGAQLGVTQEATGNQPSEPSGPMLVKGQVVRL